MPQHAIGRTCPRKIYSGGLDKPVCSCKFNLFSHRVEKGKKKKDLSGIFWRSNLLCKITCTLDVQLATIYF